MAQQTDEAYLNDARDEQGDHETMRRQFLWLRSSPTPSTNSIELQEIRTNDNVRPVHIIRASGWTNLDEPVAVFAGEEWPCAITEPYVPIAGRSREVGMMRVGVVCTFQDMPGR